MILGITGMPGSGKSTVCGMLKELGFSVVRFGDATAWELEKRGLAKTEKNEKQIRHELRQKLGQGAYALLWKDELLRRLASGEKIAVDGIYSFEEVKILHREFLRRFKLLAVLSGPFSRYERLKSRPVRPLTLEEAIARDLDEIEHLNKGGSIAMADLYLVNHGSVEELCKNLKEVLNFE